MPKSKMQRLIADSSVRNVVLASPCKRPWYNFTLQKNHVYGYAKNGRFFFVYKKTNGDSITIRRRFIRDDKDGYYWIEQRISANTDLGRDIMAVVRVTAPIEYDSPEKQVAQIYHPRIVTDPFMPMPHPRIPGGAWSPKFCYLQTIE